MKLWTLLGLLAFSSMDLLGQDRGIDPNALHENLTGYGMDNGGAILKFDEYFNGKDALTVYNPYEHSFFKVEKYNYSDSKVVSVTNQKSYLNDYRFDSVIAQFNSGNYSELITQFKDTSSATKQLAALYLKILRRVYGEMEKPNLIEYYTHYLDTTKPILNCVVRKYVCRSESSAGQLDIFFSSDNDTITTLQHVNFTPFDYSQIPYITQLTQSVIENIKNKQTSQLYSLMTKGFADRINNKKAFSNSLEALNTDSVVQFTSRVLPGGKDVYLSIYFDMPKEPDMLSLIYKLEVGRFRIDDISYLPKKK